AAGAPPHVRCGLAGLARCRPLRLRLRRLDHPPLFLLRPQALALPFRAAQDGRGGYPHAGKAPEHVLGRIGKRQQSPRQADQRQQSRADFVGKPQDVVIGEETLLAPTTVVIRSPDPHRAMHREHAPRLVGMKRGGVGAVRTSHAAAYVPLFFRLARLACRTSLANCCPASRNSLSMAPNSSASGTSTARSTSWRTVCSTLGRSSFRRASIRCSRVSGGWAEGGRAAMTQFLEEETAGEFPGPLQTTARPRQFPTQVTAAHPDTSKLRKPGRQNGRQGRQWSGRLLGRTTDEEHPSSCSGSRLLSIEPGASR